MQAALAEMSIDDLTHDAEEDVDFVVKGMLFSLEITSWTPYQHTYEVDEEDAFESDFASTEEEGGADEEAGEKALEEEERIARRVCTFVAHIPKTYHSFPKGGPSKNMENTQITKTRGV